MFILIGALLTVSTSALAAPNPKNFEPATQHVRRDVDLSLHNYLQDSYPYQIQINCDTTKRQNILNGIAEAGFLANQLYQTTPGSKYAANLDTYFGTKAAASYDKLLKTPINNAYNLYTGKTSPNDHNIYIVCNPEQERLQPCRPKVGAVTYPVGAKDSMIHICDRYHEVVKPMGDLLTAQRRGNTESATDIWASRGGVMFHEIFHMKWLASENTGDYEDQNDKDKTKLVYGPKAVADLAKRRNVEQTSLINDAYVSTAVSSYWQSVFNLGDVVQPTDVSVNQLDLAPSDNVTLPGDFKINERNYRVWTPQVAKINAYDYFPQDYPGNDCNYPSNKCNYVSSCGEHWMTIDDFDGIQGYDKAVQNFCKSVEKTEVKPDNPITGEEQVALDGGNDPNNGVDEGTVKFEINNKSKLQHWVYYNTCYDNLMRMAKPRSNGSNCYGTDNKDTKGGTWQVGKDAISYHALPSKSKKGKDELSVPDDGSGGGSPADPNGRLLN